MSKKNAAVSPEEPEDENGEEKVVENLFVSNPVPTKMPTPAELWVDPEKQAQETAVKQVLTVLPIRKPESHEFFRTHPSPEWEQQLVLLENKTERRDNYYIVLPGLTSQLDEAGIKYRMAFLYPTITLQKAFFLSPVTVPGWDGRANDWSTSAYDAAQQSKKGWLKRVSLAGTYAIFPAENFHPEPRWPENMSPEHLYHLAFRDGRIIRDFDHPVLKQLRGANFGG